MTLQVVAGILSDGHGRVLLAQRPQGAHLADAWEFPGGKIEPGESAPEALRRELHEELGIEIGAIEPLISIPWQYPEKSIVLHAYRVLDFRGEPRGHEQQALRWLHPHESGDLPMPPPDRPIVTALRLPRHYAITAEPAGDAAEFLADIDRLLASGIRLIQLRAKHLHADRLAELSAAALERTRATGAMQLLNHDFVLARALGIDGVHLPSADLMRLDARPLETDRWLAASCHDERELAHAAKIGVDFVVLGPVLPTASHPRAAALGWERFEALCAAAPLPVYALGGLCRNDVARAIQAGAQGIAGISAFQGRG
jgi:8-oxo-dGTP diphosphatase